MTILLSISLAMLVGLMLSRLAKLVSLPAVTAYLVAGIVVGPFCIGALGIEGLGFTSFEEISALKIISDSALGFIAFSIGNEFRLSQLKQTGKAATFIGIFQAVMAAVVVDVVLVLLHFAMPDLLTVPAAIVLGAIATATAPAATLMVVRQYKAKGPLTDLLLPIVAIDDAVGLVVFAVSLGVARAIQHGHVDVISIILNPLIEIVLSLVFGALMGAILTFIERFFHSRSKRMSMCIVFVFMTVALSMLKFQIGSVEIGFSSLLVCMMLGTMFCNLCDYSEELMERVDGWTTPLFIVFFVLSGAELDISVFGEGMIVLIGVVFLLARAIGKYVGAFVSAKWMKCDDNACKYLGITLLPQAGVALGMSLQVGDLGDAGALIRNIVLFSVLILELVGPMLSKIALTKAGDIIPENKTSARGVIPSKHHGPHPKQQ
ncbi:MAG: sodium:proton antiporter [Ruminococcaceae bacterium]|nr:sodium:proton antiporter [Oscillospiraceae bacterium]